MPRNNDVLIGMHAIIMGGSVIGEGCIIAAGAMVTENKVIPPRSLVMGMPGKVVRQRQAVSSEFPCALF